MLPQTYKALSKILATIAENKTAILTAMGRTGMIQ
jgi:hypothetical protein